jgi:hypothetical protein
VPRHHTARLDQQPEQAQLVIGQRQLLLARSRWMEVRTASVTLTGLVAPRLLA